MKYYLVTENYKMKITTEKIIMENKKKQVLGKVRLAFVEAFGLEKLQPASSDQLSSDKVSDSAYSIF